MRAARGAGTWLRVLPGAVALLVLAGLGVSSLASQESVIGSYTTPLEGRTGSQRHNAIRSLEEINGLIIPAGGTFSFNAHVKGWTRDLGYKRAPVSYNGQLVDAWGGGVCQTSTTLYNAALLAGFEVVDRARHHFAPTYVPPGRDAAVAYEAIDLKLRNPHRRPIQIVGRIRGDSMQIDLVGIATEPLPIRISSEIKETRPPLTYRWRGERTRTRNSGKAGFEVIVWREWENRREMISHDDYPAMNRILESSP